MKRLTTYRQAMNRVRELEEAIREHRDTFPDEALEGEHKLWAVLEDSPEKTKPPRAEE